MQGPYVSQGSGGCSALAPDPFSLIHSPLPLPSASLPVVQCPPIGEKANYLPYDTMPHPTLITKDDQICECDNSRNWGSSRPAPAYRYSGTQLLLIVGAVWFSSSYQSIRLVNMILSSPYSIHLPALTLLSPSLITRESKGRAGQPNKCCLSYRESSI